MLQKQKRKTGIRGQAVTEYVLLMAVIAGIILAVGAPFVRRMQALISNSVSRKIQESYLKKGGVHKFWMPK